MKAGPKLDVLVAEKVMGWRRGPGWRDSPKTLDRWYAGDTRLDEEHATPEGAGGGDYYQPDSAWSPSTDIRAAMEVQAALAERGQRLTLYAPRSADAEGMRIMHLQVWLCYFYQDAEDHAYHKNVHATADTAPLAICLAALAAVGVTDVPA